MGMVKYANLTLNSQASITNIGDWVQILSIDNIYERMGLQQSEIYRLSVSELSSYRGDKLILPINFPMFGIYNLSPDIVPVYLGLSVIHHTVINGLHLKENEPIGCRDNHTFVELSTNGVKCYHGGCLTVTFPKRSQEPIEGRIYLIGLSDAVFDALPDIIKTSGVRKNHVLLGDNKIDYHFAQNVLEEYKECASLVVTSKIHCAQPCLAMGIPVVFICDEKSFRYEVISRYIPIYSFTDLERGLIDWNVHSVDLEDKKSLLVDNAIRRILAAHDNQQNGLFIESGSELIHAVDAINSPTSEKDNYEIDMVSEFERYISKRYLHDESFEYSIWGVTQFAYAAVEMMQKKYPNAKIGIVADVKNREPFYGISPVSPEMLKNYNYPVLFAVPSAIGIAKNEFIRLGVKQYLISYGGVLIEDGIVKR